LLNLTDSQFVGWITMSLGSRNEVVLSIVVARSSASKFESVPPGLVKIPVVDRMPRKFGAVPFPLRIC
jgi:hypothetical protein